MTSRQLVGKYIPFALYSLGVFGLASAFINMGLVIYLNDGSKTGKIILGWTQVPNTIPYHKTTTYLIANSVLLISLYKRNMVQLWRSVVLLFCAGFIFVLFMGIMEIAESYMNENGSINTFKLGSGKVPVIKPHDQTWYNVSDFFVAFTYVVGIITIFEAIIGGILVQFDTREVSLSNLSDTKAEVNQDIQNILLNEENQEDFRWETSMEPTYPEHKPVGTPSPINTLPSKPCLLKQKSDYSVMDVRRDESPATYIQEDKSSINSYFGSSIRS